MGIGTTTDMKIVDSGMGTGAMTETANGETVDATNGANTNGGSMSGANTNGMKIATIAQASLSITATGHLLTTTGILTTVARDRQFLERRAQAPRKRLRPSLRIEDGWIELNNPSSPGDQANQEENQEHDEEDFSDTC